MNYKQTLMAVTLAIGRFGAPAQSLRISRVPR